MKRLPLLRGKGRNKTKQTKPTTLPISALSVFADTSDVTLVTLKKQGLIGEGVRNVKILAGGKLTVALNVSVPCSQSAKVVIEKAGGTVA